MYSEKPAIIKGLGKIAARGSSAVRAKVLNPFSQYLRNLREETVRCNYYYGDTSTQRKGLHNQFFVGTVLEKAPLAQADQEYWVKLGTDSGIERIFKNKSLWEYKPGDRLLLTVFIRTNDTWDYIPHTHEGFRRKQIVLSSLPLEYQLMGIMQFAK